MIGVFGAGNLFQANQVTAVLLGAVGDGFWADNRWLLGVVHAIGVAAVILGGITSIARWTARITPAMAILYTICALAVVGANIDRLPAALAAIVTGAFTPEGATGGVIGVAVVGIQRALFSNAAGVGSAGMAHSASKTKDPATEGFTAMWEPLIDFVVVCTLTALAITVSGAHEAFAGDAGADGVAITATAFSSVSSWFPVLLTVSVVLFGFSTILSYSYYGELAAAYLFGDGRGVRVGFRIFWVLAVIVGAASSLDAVILFSDSMFFLMSVPNLLGLYLLGRVVRLEILRRRARRHGHAAGHRARAAGGHGRPRAHARAGRGGGPRRGGRGRADRARAPHPRRGSRLPRARRAPRRRPGLADGGAGGPDPGRRDRRDEREAPLRRFRMVSGVSRIAGAP